jgi:hypothetical protein
LGTEITLKHHWDEGRESNLLDPVPLRYILGAGWISLRSPNLKTAFGRFTARMKNAADSLIISGG